MHFQKENPYLWKTKLLQILMEGVGFMVPSLGAFLQGFSILLVLWRDGHQVNLKAPELKKLVSLNRSQKILWMMRILANMELHHKLLKLQRIIQQ